MDALRLARSAATLAPSVGGAPRARAGGVGVVEADGLGGVGGRSGVFAGLSSVVGEKRASSTSCVPRQKLVRRVPPGVKSGMSGGCEPGIAAVTPRMGSVSSRSGEGSASGAKDTFDPAHRIAAALVIVSPDAAPGVDGWFEMDPSDGRISSERRRDGGRASLPGPALLIVFGCERFESDASL